MYFCTFISGAYAIQKVVLTQFVFNFCVMPIGYNATYQ